MKEQKRNHYPQHEFLFNYVVGDGVDDVDAAVDRLLFALGFRSKLHGTAYLKAAIELWYTVPNTCQVVLSSDVYPQVAMKFRTTAERVERSIRNTLRDCHHHGKLLLFNDLTQSEIISPRYVPTNGEFLSSVVSWLRMQRRESHRQMSFLRLL